MGRYYCGDIDGKFWFAVQPSDAADRFGSRGTVSEFLELDYYFKEQHLENIREELEAIEKKLGDYKEKLDKFFEENNSYTDDELAKSIGVDKDTVIYLLKEYADYELGKKIEKCVLENGECVFTAEF